MPRGPIGPVGPTGPAGDGVRVLGSYINLRCVQAAHPTGDVGDAYIVGTDLYVWDAEGLPSG
jgi:hypothetical protein